MYCSNPSLSMLPPPAPNERKGSDVTWSDAEAELVKMSDMRCPGDMLRCIIRCEYCNWLFPFS